MVEPSTTSSAPVTVARKPPTASPTFSSTLPSSRPPISTITTTRMAPVLVTNPGLWMAHCHIAEHSQSGMMFSFPVTEGVPG